MATSVGKPDPDLALATPSAMGVRSEVPVDEPPAPGHDALQALLAFAALHEQIRQRRAREAFRHGHSWNGSPDQFVFYEVLQLVAERALALTGADGVAIALVEEGAIVCRAAAGGIAPDIGAKLDPNKGLSGTCFRTAQLVRCDDSENDPRVDAQASRKLQARSMIAVPLCGRTTVIGLIEAFSTVAYGFNDSDVNNLTLLGELILGALKPEEEEQLEAFSPVQLHGVALHGILPKPPEKLAPAPVPVEPITAEPAVHEPIAAEPSIVQSIAPEERAPAVPAKTVEGATDKVEVAPVVIAENRAEPVLQEPKSIAIEHPELGTLELETIKISELFAPPIPHSEPAETSLEFGAGEEEPTAAESGLFADYQKSKTSHTGLVIVLSLVAVALAAAGIVWWRLQVGATASASVAPTVVAGPAIAPEQPKVESTAAPVPAVTATDVPAEIPSQNSVAGDEAAHNVLPVVTGIRHWESEGSTTVVIDLQDQVQYEVHRLGSPERIYFDLHDTTLSPELARGKTIEVGDSLLVRIRVAQAMPGVARVVLETRDVSNFSVSLEANPYRLVAEIRRSMGEKPSGSDVLKPQGAAQHKLSSSLAPASKSAVPRAKIVVDAGHGGWDLGTVGRKGLLEKDLVLDIAQRLGKLIESRGLAEVIYTRSDDNYVPLEKRAELANDAQADLFVSVHANYSDYPSARGVETYYTNFSTPANALEIEKRENATAKSTPSPPGLTGIALKERTEESRHLAASVERSLYSTLVSTTPGIRDRGVKEAGFVVLTGTSMPAVLAEVSFVSSPTDEKNLQSSAYRERIAEALYKGIAGYETKASHVKLASASGTASGK